MCVIVPGPCATVDVLSNRATLPHDGSSVVDRHVPCNGIPPLAE